MSTKFSLDIKMFHLIQIILESLYLWKCYNTIFLLLRLCTVWDICVKYFHINLFLPYTSVLIGIVIFSSLPWSYEWVIAFSGYRPTDDLKFDGLGG